MGTVESLVACSCLKLKNTDYWMIAADNISFGKIRLTVNYCPECGRNLKEPEEKDGISI